MKFKTTKRDIRNGYYRIIRVGYCDLQHLLYWESPVAYSAGTNGWCCDYYDIDGVLISTGYSPVNSKNTNADYDLIRKFDNLAQKAGTKEEIKELLNQFIEEATGKETMNTSSR